MNDLAGSMSAAQSDLAIFVQQALAYGKQQFERCPPSEKVDVQVGETSFRLAESQNDLRSSVDLCLWSGAASEIETPPFSVYVDYTSWHLRSGFRAPHHHQKDLLELNKALAQIGVKAIYSPEEQRWDIFDPVAGFGVRLQCGTERSPVWEKTAPLVHFCNWIALENGKTMLHAASIGTCNSGVLLVGDGGAGKSGTTLGALIEGLQSAGDDYTLITNGPDFRAHAIHMSVKQDPSGLERLGLSAAASLNWQGKAVFRPETQIGHAISTSVPVNALVMPETGAAKARYYPIAAGQVFKTLTFSSLKQLGSDHKAVFQTCAELVRSLPCYKLELSKHNQENVSVLTDILESVT